MKAGATSYGRRNTGQAVGQENEALIKLVRPEISMRMRNKI